jgi:hypothetical protein
MAKTTKAKGRKPAKKKSRRSNTKKLSARTQLVTDLDRKILDLASRHYGKLRKKLNLKPDSKPDLVLALGEKVLARVRAFRSQPEGKPADQV